MLILFVIVFSAIVWYIAKVTINNGKKNPKDWEW